MILFTNLSCLLLGNLNILPSMKARSSRSIRKLLKRHSKKAGLPPGSLIATSENTESKTTMTLYRYNESEIKTIQIESLNEISSISQADQQTWLNIDATHDVTLLKNLGDKIGLHPLVLEDVLNTDQRPKIEDHGNYFYIVLKMFVPNNSSWETEQVSLILGSDYLVSIQESNKPGDVFENARQRINGNTGKIRKQKVDFLAYSLLDLVVDNYFVVLESFGEKLEDFEQKLLTHTTSETVSQIHHFRHELILLRKSVWPLRELLSNLYRSESSLLAKETAVYLRDVYDHTIQVIDTLESFRDVLASLQDIYLSNISLRMNEIMKVLTVISTIFIPLTFLAGVYGMNFKHMPEMEWRWSYPIFWLIILATAGVMLSYFRKREWI